MSIYNWNDAPEWANYAATDKNGKAYWFEDKPSYDKEWVNSIYSAARLEFYKTFPIVPCLSRDSLERRPGIKDDDKLSLKEQVLSLFTTGALIVGECNVCDGIGEVDNDQDSVSTCEECHGTGISVREGNA